MRRIWWVRRDLRLDDNPAVQYAASGTALLPLFIAGDADEGDWPLGGAQRWWLAQGLPRFAAALERVGSRLVVVEGDAEKVISDLVRRHSVDEVVWSRRFDPAGLAAERRVEAALDRLGVAWKGFLSNHLHDPEEIATKEGKPYQVYTPFSRNCAQRPAPARPKAAPRALAPADGGPKGVRIESLGLEPSIDWAGGLRETWTPGEEGAAARLLDFTKAALERYPTGRDEPSSVGTSMLSPHLAFGEIGIRRVWHAALASGAAPESIAKFHSELLWREFATHVLYHFPRTTLAPLRAEFARFPWRNDPAALRLWQRGRTGYPLVDAGMRQLWHTGWMHNRVRMVVASFLVKHLLLPWQDGARWFWDTLVDADLANNSLGWQWAAGCGADAAPYFRIFNPTSQAEKFDAEARYIKRWVPELAALPPKVAVDPAGRGGGGLFGIGEGLKYSAPMVDHAMARSRALAALAAVSKGGAKASGPAKP